MKRSEINAAYREALAVFQRTGCSLPPRPRWDITDCGSGDFNRCGLVLVNLADEPEYSEKLIYLRPGQAIPAHTHRKKKEDIICRRGELMMELWAGSPAGDQRETPVRLKRSGEWTTVTPGRAFALGPGERVTVTPGLYHRFWASQPDTIIGEVATANDDANDNFFSDPAVLRFSRIEEDEPALVKLVGDP